ncbi:MAG: helix-turn-helix transcriptional regulator [Clostridia bacterium]|nr:helix-turn-helix transcriptional regulator [Clostridia bacterium]
MSIFAQRLKELHVENNLTQAELAHAIGYTQRAVSKWINGQAEPSATAILRCAEFFDVSTDYLLGVSDK